MLGPGELDEAVVGQRGLLPGIEACIKARCLISSLTLIYSAIDAVSALTRPIKAADTDKAIFEAWVKAYMAAFLTATNCSAEDVYAARCGLVHTTTRGSRLSRSKAGVRTFVYYWRHGPRPDSAVAPAHGALQVCVEDLRDAFVSGLAQFGQARALSTNLAARVAHHEPDLLCYRPWSSVTVRVA
jgi:hypothetical protein